MANFKVSGLRAVLCLLPVLVSCTEPRHALTGGYNYTVSGDTLSVGPARVLVLKGNHRDRGYTHGYLLAVPVKELFDNFFVPVFFKGDAGLYNTGRSFVMENVYYEKKYVTEAAALIDGMAAAGVDLYNPVLDRDLDFLDILMFNTLEELIRVADFQYGCSSISSWGTATAADSMLKGDLVITRFWDWKPYEHIVRNLMLIVHLPAETAEQNWVSCGWAGVLGACSGMNSAGVGAFLDYGNIKDFTRGGPFHPVSLSLRNAIEQADYNQDGSCTTQDIVDAIAAYTPAFASIIHAVSPVSRPDPVLVIESNNAKGLVVRRQAENTQVPGSHLVVTNHFRVLYPPEAEPIGTRARYAAIADSLSADSSMSCPRSWDVLTGAAGNAWSLYQVQFVPLTGKIKWRTATGIINVSYVPAPAQPALETSLAELFNY